MVFACKVGGYFVCVRWLLEGVGGFRQVSFCLLVSIIVRGFLSALMSTLALRHVC